ncbi:MAG: VWA domain-containing protein, partial [Erysipelotrichaceae bacterium]|nr:VWA domain-containing protein [Erysipelotrichaceae bacterium]
MMTPISVIADEQPTPPENSKELIDNGDGTYTLALSVTGSAQSSTITKVDKANVVFVLDTSSSMNNSSADPYVYTAVEGTPAGGPGAGTYYGQDAEGDYFQLYWRNNQWRTANGNNSPVYSGTFFTRQEVDVMTRLEAEKDAFTKEGGIVDKLMGQNVAGDPVKSDIIEVAIVGFGGAGAKVQDATKDPATVKNTINGLTTTQGTNWEEALRYAKEYADDFKQRQPNEDVYVIFLTDGEPTTHYNDHTVSTDFDTEWGYANDDANAIVEAGYVFYGLF